jgi:biotin-(acetyl-CoA carboxylase) ligase
MTVLMRQAQTTNASLQQIKDWDEDLLKVGDSVALVQQSTVVEWGTIDGITADYKIVWFLPAKTPYRRMIYFGEGLELWK